MIELRAGFPQRGANGGARPFQPPRGRAIGQSKAADPGERLVVRWWPEHAPSRAGRVEFELVPCVSGTRLVVRETAPSAAATTSRWNLRMTVLAFAVTNGVRAYAWA